MPYESFFPPQFDDIRFIRTALQEMRNSASVQTGPQNQAINFRLKSHPTDYFKRAKTAEFQDSMRKNDPAINQMK